MNKRQEMILISLKTHHFLNRDQIMKLHDLKSKGNTNKVLKCMKPYISSFREGFDTIYYLSKEGREMVGCERICKKTPQINHFIMRNQFYLFAQCPKEWKIEQKIGGQIVCDAAFKQGGKWHFLEVDNNATMTANKKKIEKYKKLYESKMFQNHKDYGYFPTLLWLTTNDFRQKKLLELCRGLPCNVFMIDDIK
ncbi:replication-relaxation family protein [Fictibacillus sp. 7GRE50]|uniref:replication-relaxation family protein n=1 Tax=Fictibacillus sp. 7GRE50 TaxID=2745878 RepID=UPI0018CF00FE|nr:replication-relaxation family protein [Fictibacillus sp. 7GRE50]MBH0166295.1 replication-relaxation family protein [Fictibacillus sp. 7GRE50]